MTDDPEPPRDIMQGWRVLPDPEDPPEIRRSFGYEHMVLTRRARRWLAAMGVPETRSPLDKSGVEWHAARAYERFCQARPTYREISDARSLRSAWETRQAWAAGTGERGGFTRPELLNLQERYAGANDPISQAIEAKVAALLAEDDG